MEDAMAGKERLIRMTREDDRKKRWIVVGNHGAIDFYVDKDHLGSGGVEYHYRTPPEYQRGEEPAREHCWVLGSQCWSDGSSLWASKLWASKHWIPLLEREGEDAVWRELEYHYHKHAWPSAQPCTCKDNERCVEDYGRERGWTEPQLAQGYYCKRKRQP